MLVQCFSEPDGRLTGFAFAVCSATHTAFARRRTMYATERTINRPGAQSDVAVAFRIDFRGVTNEYRHHPSYHSYPCFGGRHSSVGAQQELGVRTQRHRRGRCCHSDSPAPPREALSLRRQWARPDWSRGPVHRRRGAHSATILCSVAICFHCPSSSLMRLANAAGLIASGSVPSGSSTGAKSGDAAIALIS